MRQHPDELEDLLPSRDEARAQHVVHAEGLGRGGGRRGAKNTTPRYAVYQNAPQLGEPPQRIPWLVFWLAGWLAFWLVGWLAGWWLAGFWAGWLFGLLAFGWRLAGSCWVWLA